MTDAERLDLFMDRYSPSVARNGREALGKLRSQLPGAVELVSDNYTGLSIGFGPTKQAGDAVLSLTFAPRHVALSFLHAKDLPDPDKLFKGEAAPVRTLKLGKTRSVDDPEVQDLISRAVMARGGWDPHRPPQLVIKSVSPKQMPRRP